MEDVQIIELYWQRNEQAIAETAQKYGAFCHSIAKNILSIDEDAEECVNDAFHQAWNAIPPQRPVRFRAWLGKTVRNLALNLWNKNHAQKGYAGMTLLLTELEDCIPAPQTVEREIEEKELTGILERWLRSMDREDQVLFVRRYWNGMALKELAKEQAVSPGKLAQRMYRLWKRRGSGYERKRDGKAVSQHHRAQR